MYCSTADQAELVEVYESEPAAEPKPAADPVVPADPLIGQVFGGRYEIRALLGAGGMGAVYEGWDRTLPRKVAVKVMLESALQIIAPTPAERAEYHKRFLREARAAASLHHPNVVVIHDRGEAQVSSEPASTQQTQRFPYLVMEFLEGQSLLSRVARGPMPLRQAVKIALQIAQALAHAHKNGVWHRDIKLENIFLSDQDGQSDVVKVMDFGIARILTEAPVTFRPEQIFGTPHYLAPECWAQEIGVATESDVYALGVVMYELLTGGINPFEQWIKRQGRETAEGEFSVMWALAHTKHVPSSLGQQPTHGPIPQELDSLIAALMAKDPKARPTAESTQACLQKILAELPGISLGRTLLLKSQRLILADSKLQDASTQPMPAGPLTARELQTQRLLRRGEQFHAATTMTKAQARWLQLEAAAGALDQLEPELDTVSGEVYRLTHELRQRKWKDSPPETIRRLSHRVLSVLEQRKPFVVALKDADDAWQDELARIERERRSLHDELVEADSALAADDAPAHDPRRTLQDRKLEAEWRIVAVKTDVALAERLFDAQRQLHSLTYTLHHAIFLEGEAVTRELDNTQGPFGRFRRGDPDLIRLKQELSKQKQLLERTRKIWETFPILTPTETIRVPDGPPPSKRPLERK